MFDTDLVEVISALDRAARIGGLLGEATAYHLDSGGKAWRARLAIAGSNVLGAQPEHRVGLAVACELVHQASVVHDDVQDGAVLRRGRECVAARFSAPTALCVGDHLLVSAFGQLAKLPEPSAVIQLFSAAISQMAAAQAEEFNTSLWPTMTWSRYEGLAAGKSGAMIMLPICGAALLAGLEPSDIEALGDAAKRLGLAYQAGDDIEDLSADIATGSLNGVIVRALENADSKQRACWLDLLARARRQPLSSAEAIGLAASWEREVAVVEAWISDLLLGTLTDLRERLSPRGQDLAPVVKWAAATLSERKLKKEKDRHAA